MTTNDALLAAPREAWILAERCAQQKVTNLTRNGTFAAMYEAVQHEDAIAHLERLLAGLKADGIGKDALRAGFEAHGKAVKAKSAPLIRLAASRQFEIVERVNGLQGKIQSADAIREEAIKKYRDAGLSLAKIEQVGLPHTAEGIAAWREEVEALRAEDTQLSAYLADWPFHDPRSLEGTTLAAAAGLTEPEALAA